MNLRKTKIILFFVVIFAVFSFSKNVFAATETISIVRPDCANKSIPTANCYTSLYDWESGEDRDLTVGDEIAVAQIEGNWTSADTNPVVISGWTTDADRYVKVVTDFQNRAGATGIDSNKYRLLNSTDVSSIAIQDRNVRIDGLQIINSYDNQSSTGVYVAGVETVALGEIRVSNCYIDSTVTGGTGINIGDADIGTAKIWNNVIVKTGTINGFTSEGIIVSEISTGAEIYNNTVYGFDDGIEILAGVNTLKNNAVFASIDDFDLSGGTNTMDYNASDDGDGTNAVTPASWASVFENYATFNFRLKNTDIDLRDMGVTNPGSGLFSNDIGGQSRPFPIGGAWDIGADEYVLKPVYYSVGQNTTSHETGAGNVTVSGTTATFTVAQTATNMGVGDVIDYDTDNKKCYISGKTSQTIWTCTNATGDTPTSATDVIVNSVSHAFNSLSAAEAGAPTLLGSSSLTTLDVQLNFPCYYDTGADTTAVTIDGYTTDATRYIKIYTPNNISAEVNQSQRQSGVWNNRKYVLSTNGSALNLADDYIQVDGLQINHINPGGAWQFGIQYLPAAARDCEIKISNNIIKRSSDNPTMISNGISTSVSPNNGSGVYIWNNIIYDFGQGSDSSSGILIQDNNNSNRQFVYNNTVINTYNGFRVSGGYVAPYAGTLINNIAQNCTIGFSDYWSTSSDYNISDLASDAPGANSKNSTTVTFVDEANDDFHLSSNDTAAKNAGADLSADANLPFNTDIDGETRQVGMWDIGADEIPAVEFVSIIDPGNGANTDYTSLIAWENAVQTNLATTTTKVFVGTRTNVLADNATVYLCRAGTYQTVTANLRHATLTQVLVQSISSSSFAFLPGDVWYANDTCNSAAYFSNTSTGDNAIAVASCRTTNSIADTSAVAVDSWTTSATNYIKIYTPSSARHKGVWDDAKYNISIHTGTGITINESDVQIIGLQIKNDNTGQTATAYGINHTNNTENILIDSNLLVGRQSGQTYDVFGIDSEGGNNISIRNNILIGFERGLYFSDYDVLPDAWYVYNNTIYKVYASEGFSFQYQTTTGLVLRNNIVSGSSTDDYYSLPTSFVHSSNISSDTTSPDASFRTKTVAFVDATTFPYDLHLLAANTEAINRGYDLRSSFDTDIDGQTRPYANAFDIGADEWTPVVSMGGTGSKGAPPVLDLRFDEGKGEIAYDKSASNNDGTLVSGGSGANATSSAMWDKGGKFGGGVEFDGTNDYVDVGNIDYASFGNEISISAWIKKSSFSGNDFIVSTYNGTTGMYFDTYGATELQWRIGGTEHFTTGFNFSAGQWYHLAGTYDRNNVILYINGMEFLREAETDPIETVQSTKIGSNVDGSSFFCDGLIDELKIYNYALSESEVKTLYNGGVGLAMGGKGATANNNGTIVTGSNAKYCVPGDTARCDKPVLELRLDEMTGTTAFDKSGNGNDGTLSGATWETLGKVGGAVRFDGVDDYVNAGSNSSLDDLGPMTIESWFYARGYGEANAGMIIGKDEHNGLNGSWSLRYTTDNRLTFRKDYTDTDLRVFSSNNTVPYDKWQHVAVTWTGGNSAASDVKIFIDGKEVSHYSNVDGIGTKISDINQDVYIGNNVSASATFDGLIDDVKIYNYARTPAQIAWDYNRGKPVGHWKFDEGSGVQVDDSSGNGNHGIMTDMDPATDRVEGKFGKGLDFDGSNDWINISDNSALDIANAVSFSAWIKPRNLWANDHFILEKRTLDVNESNYWVYLNGDKLNFGLFNGGWSEQDSNFSVIADEWQHVVATFDNSVLTFYLNGKKEEHILNETLLANSGPLAIGRSQFSGNYRYFDGLLDDIKIYSYKLTDEQIKSDYNNGGVNFR